MCSEILLKRFEVGSTYRWHAFIEIVVVDKMLIITRGDMYANNVSNTKTLSFNLLLDFVSVNEITIIS